jgi:uncharacterized protein YkwD
MALALAPLAVVAALVAGPAEAGAGSPTSPCGETAAIVLAAVNGDRAAAALPPLRLSAALCVVAQERAAELAGSEREPEPPVVTQITGQLQRRGYRAHLWHERTVVGPRDVGALLHSWRASAPDSWRETALGEHEDLGVGLADRGGPPVWVLLVATPRVRFEERLARPLADLDAVRREVLAATNAARARRGRPPLVADPQLDTVAQAHARDMLERRYYDHRDPEGRAVRGRVRRLGLDPRRLGENLARGIFSPAEVVERWLLSSGHRRNILEPEFTRLGVGMSFATRGDDVDVLWVQVFATAR